MRSKREQLAVEISMQAMLIGQNMRKRNHSLLWETSMEMCSKHFWNNETEVNCTWQRRMDEMNLKWALDFKNLFKIKEIVKFC